MSKTKKKASSAVKSTRNAVKKIDPTSKEGRQLLAKVAVTAGVGFATGGVGLAVGGGLLAGATDKKQRDDKKKVEKAEAKQRAAEGERGQIAINEYNFAREMDFVKDEYANRVEQLGTQEMQNSVMGRANIDAQAGTAGLASQVSGNLQAQGIDPSSGRSNSAMNNVQSASGDAIGRAQSESAFALDSSHLEGQNNRIAMAMGEKTKAVAGLQDIARGANQLSNQRAMDRYNSRAANRAAIGTAAGMAGQAYIGRDKE